MNSIQILRKALMMLRIPLIAGSLIASTGLSAKAAEGLPPTNATEATDMQTNRVREFDYDRWLQQPSELERNNQVKAMVNQYNQTLLDYQRAEKQLLQAKTVRIIIIVAALSLVLVFFFWKVLGESKLRRKLKKLEKEAKERVTEDHKLLHHYLTSLSHEIRTPLNGISGMADLLSATPLTEKQEEYLNLLKSSSQSLLANVTDLIEVNRNTQADSTASNLPFDIHEALGQVLDMASEKAQERRLGLSVFTDTRIHRMVKGDSLMVRHILSLILRDAISRSNQGNIGLKTELIGQQDILLDLRFTVLDTGDKLPDVNELLEQSEEPGDILPMFAHQRKNARLVRAFSLIRMLGGLYGIESFAGQGNHIWFSLRFEIAQDTSFDHAQQSFMGIHVLLMDENMTSRLVFRHYLNYFGCKTDEAAHFDEGFEMLSHSVEKHPYQVVIINLMEIDTVVLEKIKEFKSQTNQLLVHVILTTSTGFLLSTGELKRYGVVAFLNKPVKLTDLYDAIKNCLSSAVPTDRVTPLKPPIEQEKGLTILLAEDNLISEKVATATLQRMGHTVEVAENGKVVLQKINEKRYDLILMDIEMPEMNGLETTRILRSVQTLAINGKPVPVIALTANAMPNDREKCLEAGMNGYISKPFKHEELIKILNSIY